MGIPRCRAGSTHENPKMGRGERVIRAADRKNWAAPKYLLKRSFFLPGEAGLKGKLGSEKIFGRKRS